MERALGSYPRNLWRSPHPVTKSKSAKALRLPALRLLALRLLALRLLALRLLALRPSGPLVLPPYGSFASPSPLIEGIPPEYQGVAVGAGAFMVLFGRRLFWFTVGGVGFLCGLSLGTLLRDSLEEWAVLALAAGLGLLGLFLALLLQKLTIRIAGFVAGGYLVAGVVEWHYGPVADLYYLYFLIGGVIGLVLVATVFEWALVFLSSLTGAILIAQNLPSHIPARLIPIAVITLVFVGIMVQARALKRKPPPPPQR